MGEPPACWCGQPEEAIEHYQIYLKANPLDAKAHNNLGVAFGELGRTNEAIAEFSEVLRLDPMMRGAESASKDSARLGVREPALACRFIAASLQQPGPPPALRLRELRILLQRGSIFCQRGG